MIAFVVRVKSIAFHFICSFVVWRSNFYYLCKKINMKKKILINSKFMWMSTHSLARIHFAQYLHRISNHCKFVTADQSLSFFLLATSLNSKINWSTSKYWFFFGIQLCHSCFSVSFETTEFEFSKHFRIKTIKWAIEIQWKKPQISKFKFSRNIRF